MPRRPLKSDEELLALAQRLEAQYGMVTVPALRAAAGGGSPNRLRRIIEAMPKHGSGTGRGEPPVETAFPAAEGPEPSAERPARPEPRAARVHSVEPRHDLADIEVAQYAARLEELQRSHDTLLTLLREERHERQSELEILSRLIERQNGLIDQLGRMIELALKATQSDLSAMREEFNQVAHRIGAASDRGGVSGTKPPSDGVSSFQ